MEITKIAEDVGYIKGTLEQHNASITKFYSLLDKHMEEEDKKNKKLWNTIVAVLLLNILQSLGIPAIDIIQLIFKLVPG